MFRISRNGGTKKKSETPTGIEPMIFRKPVGCSNLWGTGRLVASEVISTRFVVTRVLHTAMISNVESAMWDFVLQDTQVIRGSIPFGDSEFLFVPHLRHPEYSIFSYGRNK